MRCALQKRCEGVSLTTHATQCKQIKKRLGWTQVEASRGGSWVGWLWFVGLGCISEGQSWGDCRMAQRATCRIIWSTAGHQKCLRLSLQPSSLRPSSLSANSATKLWMGQHMPTNSRPNPGSTPRSNRNVAVRSFYRDHLRVSRECRQPFTNHCNHCAQEFSTHLHPDSIQDRKC